MAYISYNKLWESEFDGEMKVIQREINYKMLILVN